jgi:aerobic carbon-monoxide dehydrogenase medium subunit
LSLRLARPGLIIDINRIGALVFIRAGADGGLSIGALARQRAVERSKDVSERSPLMTGATALIGHFQIRNRGTVGGSLVHADPAAELPAVALVLGAKLTLRSARADRTIHAEDFFAGYMSTAIEPNELLTEIQLPAPRPRTGWAIEEIARRRGDFAIIGATVLMELDENDTCRNARIAMFGTAEKPLRMERAERCLNGNSLNEDRFAEAADLVAADLDAVSDVHASVEYRKEVAAVLARRALKKAVGRAKRLPS